LEFDSLGWFPKEKRIVGCSGIGGYSFFLFTLFPLFWGKEVHCRSQRRGRSRRGQREKGFLRGKEKRQEERRGIVRRRAKETILSGSRD
jgi:hypothetical protein